MEREKNFIRQTRPSSKKELVQAVKDIDRQIHYWESIGGDHNAEIEYWHGQQVSYKSRLEAMRNQAKGIKK